MAMDHRPPWPLKAMPSEVLSCAMDILAATVGNRRKVPSFREFNNFFICNIKFMKIRGLKYDRSCPWAIPAYRNQLPRPGQMGVVGES